MSATIIKLHRKTNAPTRRLVFEGFDLTGSAVLIEVTPDNGPSVTVSTATGELTLDGTDAVIWSYDEAFVAALPLGLRTRWDLYRTIDGKTDKLTAGMLQVLGPGEIDAGGDVVVHVPGPQGPKGDKGDKGDDGSLSEEGLAAAQAAIDAAAAAGLGAAATAADRAQTGLDRAATGADRTQTGLDRVAAGQDRTAVATDKTAVEGYYNKIVAAPKTISAATYTLLVDDIGRVLRFTNATGCVLTLPAAIAGVPGWWAPLRRLGGPVTWVAEAGSAVKPDSAATAGIAGQWTTVTLSVDSAGVWLIEGVLT